MILVTHSMEDVARLVDRLIVMDRGRVALDGTPVEVFRQAETLKELGLGLPQVTELMHELKAKGMAVDTDVLTVEAAEEEIVKALGARDEISQPDHRPAHSRQFGCAQAGSPHQDLRHHPAYRALICRQWFYRLRLSGAGHCRGDPPGQAALALRDQRSAALLVILLLTVGLNVFLTEGEVIFRLWFLTITRKAWRGVG